MFKRTRLPGISTLICHYQYRGYEPKHLVTNLAISSADRGVVQIGVADMTTPKNTTWSLDWDAARETVALQDESQGYAHSSNSAVANGAMAGSRQRGSAIAESGLRAGLVRVCADATLCRAPAQRSIPGSQRKRSELPGAGYDGSSGKW